MKPEMKAIVRCCSVAALCWSGTSLAQSSPQGSAAVPVSDTQGLQDIIVTAQKREQNLQRVPIAITALTPAVLQDANISDVSSLQVLVPALNWGFGVGGGNISIRGISGTGSAGDESANAVYIDGVYQPVSTSLVMALANLQGIEVLKGPQGTLFGRNASGGAILISTRDPSDPQAIQFSVGYANYSSYETKGYANFHISDSLSADFSGYYDDQRDGWGTDVTTGRKNYIGHNLLLRTKWKWQPTDRDTVNFAYSYGNVRPQILNGSAQVLNGQGRPYYGFFGGSSNDPFYEAARQSNASITVSHEIDWVIIKNIASYDYVNNPFYNDGDYLAIPYVTVSQDTYTHSRSWTEELQLTSPPSSKLVWAAGLFYFDNMNERYLELDGPAFAPTLKNISFVRSPSQSYAGYAQLTYPVWEHTRITGGLRYTQDRRRLNGYAIVPTGVRSDYSSSNTDTNWSWRAVIDQDLSNRVLIYASATTGFKSGFYNISAASNPVTKPQKIMAYEVGIKSGLLDNRLRLNLAGFYYNFTDIQVRGSTLIGPVFENAASATIKGIDMDFQARPIPSLTLQGGLTYLDGTYDRFPNAPLFGPGPGGVGIVSTGFGDVSGKSLTRTPKWTASVSATQTWPLANGGDVQATVAFYHNDGFYFDPQNRLAQPNYNLLDASLAWMITARINLMVWGKNLNNARYYSTIDNSSPIGDIYKPSAPRTYGITLSYKTV